MRNSLSFDLDQGSVVRLKQDLQNQLQQLEPSHQRALYSAIGRYLQQTINRRLDSQQDAQGRKFLRRKHLKWDGQPRPAKMLQGMKNPHLSITNNQVSVGYRGGKAALAKWHNEGKAGSDGKRRPQRQWLDLSPGDIRHIQTLINQHLSST